MGGSRGGGQGAEPLTPEKSQKYRVSYQYWCGSTENPKATKQEFNVDHHRHASETQRFTGRTMMARLHWLI